MMNGTLRRKFIQAQARRGNLRLRALLGTCLGILALLLLWVQPVAAQAVGPVYALPGTLSVAFNRPYETILTTADGTQYGLVGQTPDIEAQIVEFRDQDSDVVVEVWGDRYAAATENEVEVIVVSSIQVEETAQPTPDEAPTATPLPPSVATPVPTATPAPTIEPTPAVPVAVVTAATVNVRSGPGTDYTRVGSVTEGEACAITGRNQSSTWWQLSCAAGTSGWVSGDLLALAGPVAEVAVVQTAPPPTPVPPETFAFWRSSFFNNPSLSGSPVLTIDSPNINFNWGGGSPGGGVPADNFSARFERTMEFNYGTYEIALTMDDGAILLIDDELVIDDWNIGSSRTRVARRVLSGSSEFRVEYFEAGGNAQIDLSISLVSSSQAWQVSYYGNQNLSGSPILQRGEPRGGSAPLDYNWGRGGPGSGLPVDDWSARWVGTFNFEGGDYRFVSNSDDGVRVYIDGIQLIDRWQNGYHVNVTNTFRQLGPGNHEIVVEYYESYGDAIIRVWWERIGGGGGGDNGSTDPGRPRAE